jgi:acetyl esterase/lipase
VRLTLLLILALVAGFSISEGHGSPLPPEQKMLSTADYMASAPVPPDHRVPYGPGPAQFGDLYLPKGEGPFRVVVFLHGGCWLSDYGLGPVSGLARALADGATVAVWNVEYRRIGDPGGGWPGTFLDVAASIDFLAILAKRFPLRLDRVTAAGHSAGGHLALWAAGRARLSKESPITSPAGVTLTRVVALAAIADLKDGADAKLCGGSIPKLIGTPEGKRLADSSPAAMLPLGVPQVLVSGEKDLIVPLHHVRRYARAARERGDRITEIEIPHAGHFEIVSPVSAAWPAVLKALGSE